jgi:small subunit ribosomal protein S1
MPFWWRVTRYDPARRDARGAYPVEAWTSVADVGGRFEGVPLTREEYERVETAYVEGFAAFAEDSGVSRVVVRGLEVGDGLSEGEVVSIDAGRSIVRRLLREEVVCRLEAPGDAFAVHIGFDLYMYVGSAEPCDAAIRRAEALGLFVEPVMVSPLWAEAE